MSALVARIEASGARARVEARLATLARQASAVLVEMQVTEEARSLLRGAVTALTERER